MSFPAWSLMQIAAAAQETAELAEAHPNPEMMNALAEISDETWRAMIAALRYPGDLRKIMEAL